MKGDFHVQFCERFAGENPAYLLCGLVISGMQRQPTSGEVFVFLNRNRTHMKLLHWEKRGFVLYYKLLERGTFVRLEIKSGELSWSNLVLMVEGIRIS